MFKEMMIPHQVHHNEEFDQKGHENGELKPKNGNKDLARMTFFSMVTILCK